MTGLGDSDVPAVDGGEPADRPLVVDIEFESRLSERGYRAVMLNIALLRLRWLLLVAAYFVFSALGRGDRPTALIIAGMTGGAIVIAIGYASWASGSPAHQHLYRPIRYTLSEEGLAYEAEGAAGIVEWASVRKWRLVKEHYLLYVGSSSYVLVPADDVGGPERRVIFEAALRTHVAHGPKA